MSEMYDIKGLKEWLLHDCIHGGSLVSAYSFALSGEKYRKDLVGACLEFARGGVAGDMPEECDEDIIEGIIKESQGMFLSIGVENWEASWQAKRGANVIHSTGLGMVLEDSLLGAGIEIEIVRPLVEASVSNVKLARQTKAPRAVLDGVTFLERW